MNSRMKSGLSVPPRMLAPAARTWMDAKEASKGIANRWRTLALGIGAVVLSVLLGGAIAGIVGGWEAGGSPGGPPGGPPGSTLSAQGVVALGRGDYSEAIRAFSLALAAAQPASAHLSLANPSGGQATGAQDWGEAQVEISADYANRCFAYLSLGQAQAAIADCSRSLALDPHQIEAQLHRGLAQYSLGQYEGAIADYSAILAQRLDYRAAYNRGLAHGALGNFTTALGDYQRALAALGRMTLVQEPEKPGRLAQIWNDIGVVHLVQHRYDAAIVAFDQALTADPQLGAARLNRGCAYAHRGDQIRAIADLRVAAQTFRRQGQQEAYQQTLRQLQRWQGGRRVIV